MPTVNVVSTKVFSDLPAQPEEVGAGIVYQSGGDLTAPELIDRSIEDRNRRVKLDDDAGFICVTVVPGEELGQVRLNVQFEGKSGRHEFCLDQQGQLMAAAADWLREVLDQFGIDYQVEIEAKPCPHPAKRLPLLHVIRVLSGEQVVLRPSVHADAGIAHKVEIPRGSRHDTGKR